jgi:CTP-dependent riboflavin kinase
MTTVSGIVCRGVGDFSRRMKNYPHIFARVLGENLVPGTVNVKIPFPIAIEEDLRISGAEIGEPNQDLIFEHCHVRGIRAYRIRPYNLRTGEGGHGDNVLEISSPEIIPNATEGRTMEITFLRDFV